MAILHFIFLLSVNFVIFGFIWAIIKLIISTLTGGATKSDKTEYILRITKYILLVAVTANFVHLYETDHGLIDSIAARIIVGSIVLGLYLLGKLQNKDRFSKFSAIGGNLLKGLSTSFEPKIERLLILGSIAFFVLCLLVPSLVDNFVINWFTSAIKGLYDAFFIGFIFKVVAFFSIISIIMRGSNILGKLVSGESLTESFTKEKKASPFANMGGRHFGGGDQNQQSKSNVEDAYNKKASTNTDSEGFTEYEDVTEK
tara:strand:- start:866 stop:1636 length:771 start_codon:yes stop_codon:yes gene_type:complete